MRITALSFGWVFDIEVCGRCGGSARVIACVEEQDVIDIILAHLRDKDPTSSARRKISDIRACFSGFSLRQLRVLAN
jgi:hypothetical protein